MQKAAQFNNFQKLFSELFLKMKFKIGFTDTFNGFAHNKISLRG